MNRALFIAGILIVMLCNFHADVSMGQENGDQNVDDIIEGFEDDASAGDDLEDLMQGFGDGSAEGSATTVEGDEFLEGFEEDVDGPRAETSAQEKQPPSWSLKGEFAVTSTYNFAPEATQPWQGFTMLRPELELTLKNRFSDRWQGQISARGFYDTIYVVRGRDEYTQQVLDDYESQLLLEDTFIQGSITDHLDTKIGRQIVVWGTLDNLRVTDVLNPLDLRQPGLTDIDDLRLPVTMVKFDYYFGNWDLSAMAIPEVRFSMLPVFGSDFYPFPIPRPPEGDPDEGFGNMQYAAAMTGVFSGWDIGFYWANIYADQSYAEPVSTGPPEQFVRNHPRTHMLGTAANLALGNWLLKAEVAGFNGLRYTNTPRIEYVRLDIGGGVEYSGFKEATLSLEMVNRHIFDYRRVLLLPPDEIRENEFQWSLRFMKDFMNDTLTLTLLASSFGIKADDGAFERLDAEYDVTDAMSIRGGVVFYQSGEKGLFQGIGASDRLFLVFTYSF
ncbi:hypothetical protein D3OALGA1CA_292 [Olavius algarvensis associated proteobacterium Delta 3]|nr:hypothetical protein D3OALGA1CA_292 [Olavius algarvensis associated proteobacterium Delta 3]